MAVQRRLCHLWPGPAKGLHCHAPGIPRLPAPGNIRRQRARRRLAYIRLLSLFHRLVEGSGNTGRMDPHPRNLSVQSNERPGIYRSDRPILCHPPVPIGLLPPRRILEENRLLRRQDGSERPIQLQALSGPAGNCRRLLGPAANSSKRQQP